jgi:hypothetical protein
MGGDREYYASPDVMAAGLGELIRGTLRRLSVLIAVPPGAQGGFLQPPEGSHFKPETRAITGPCVIPR